MTSTIGLGGFLTRVRGSIRADDRTDAELLAEYTRTRCESAFAELVRRFAPMVWGVCRRTVGHHQLAEDAFQAVFLVLVRKATAVRPPAVAGWLHAVAVHTSLRARTMATRRRPVSLDPERDHPATTTPTDTSDSETIRVLDEEIARLPEKLRTAVALCELDGLNRRDAAKRLGVAEGTLSSRLAAARKQLAERLRGRGVALGAGGLAALLVGGTASAVPPLVMSVSATVTALAEGAIRTMFLSKLKLTTAAMLAVALFAVFGVSALSSAAAKDRSQVRRNAPVPKAEKEGRILLWMDGKPLLLKADGTVLDSPPPIEKATLGVGWGHAKLSPDGKRVAFEKDGPPANKPRPKAAPPGVAFSRNRTTLQILDLDGKFEQNELDKVHVNGFHWLDGGKKLHVRGYEIGDGDVVSEKLEDWIYEPATDKLTSLKVPEHFVIRAISPDGKTTIVDEWKHSATEWHQHAHLWTIGSDKPTPLLELNQSFNNKHPMFSPDGKRALCQVSQYGKHTPNGNGAWTLDDFKFNNLLVVDLATKKTTVVKEYGEEADWRVAGFAWSPDGKRVAYTECQTLPQLPGKGRVYAFRVFTADPDGKNAKEIYLGQGSWLMGFDWK